MYCKWSWNCDGGKLQPAITCWRKANICLSLSGRSRLLRYFLLQRSFLRNCSHVQDHAAFSIRVSSLNPSAGRRSRKRQSGMYDDVDTTLRWHGVIESRSSKQSRSGL